VDFRRHSASAGRAAHVGRRFLRSGFRARHPARGGLAGHHSAAVLLQWDNEGIERQTVLDLFDAFVTKEKALHGNLRGHTGTHGSRASRSDNWNLRGPAPKASSATTPSPTPNRRRGVTGTSRSRQLAINRSMNRNRIGWT
jgi:hypothetical protein